MIKLPEFIVTDDYTPTEPDWLTLQKGDIIRKVKVVNGKHSGNLNGKIGLFQDLFVQIMHPTVEVLSKLGK